MLELTSHELKKAAHKLVKKFGLVVILHQQGHLGVLLAYSVKLLKVKMAIKHAYAQESDPKCKRDYGILGQRLHILLCTVVEHFKVDKAEIQAKLQAIQETKREVKAEIFGHLAAQAEEAGWSRPASPVRQYATYAQGYAPSSSGSSFGGAPAFPGTNGLQVPGSDLARQFVGR